jgi:hypothetical protein
MGDSASLERNPVRLEGLTSGEVSMRGRTAVATMTVMALSACGDGTGVEESDFVGTWDATSLEYTNAADPNQTVDVIDLGATFVITMEADGTFSATITIPGEVPEPMTGTWSVNLGDDFTIRETGVPGEMQFDYSLSGNTLTIIGGDTHFDFGDDDIEESAILDAVLVKR